MRAVLRTVHAQKEVDGHLLLCIYGDRGGEGRRGGGKGEGEGLFAWNVMICSRCAVTVRSDKVKNMKGVTVK